MKKIFAIITLAGALSSTVVHGAMQVTLSQNTSLYSSGIGGEFRAKDVGSTGLPLNPAAYSSTTSGNDGGQYYFQTFCIEYNEHFSPGGTYNADVSPNALYGNQSPGGDPVSIGTAWLYYQFAKGTLVGLTAGNVASPYDYAYGAGRVASAGALQATIWWLENEPLGAVDPGNGNVFRNAVLAQYSNPKANANGAFGVMALNLGAPGVVQDQLVIVPEPTTIIAGALLLLPFGASTIRFIRKQRAV